MGKHDGPNGKVREADRRAPPSSRLDLGLHVVSFASCAVGALTLGSVLLGAGATHYLASIGFTLLEREGDRSRRRNEGALPYMLLFLAIAMLCLLLSMHIAAKGLHGLAHAEPLDELAVLAWTIPGLATAVASARAAARRWPDRRRLGRVATDALLSAAPACLAFAVWLVTQPGDNGKLDSTAGLVLVLVLCARPVIYLVRSLE